jgi:hypothetical protein
MPHYLRLGAWNDSIASNTAAVRASKAEGSVDKFHAWDYMVHAYLQLGQDKNARAVVDEMLGSADGLSPSEFGVHSVHYALAASPARYLDGLAMHNSGPRLVMFAPAEHDIGGSTVMDTEDSLIALGQPRSVVGH